MGWRSSCVDSRGRRSRTKGSLRVGAPRVLVLALIAASCSGSGDGRVTASAESGDGFRVVNGIDWFDWDVGEGQLIYAGRRTPTTETGRAEAVLRIVSLTEERIVPLDGGPLTVGIDLATAGPDSVIVGFVPCERVGPSSDSDREKECVEEGKPKVVEYAIAEDRTSEIEIPQKLSGALEASNRFEIVRADDETVFVTTFDGVDVQAWTWSLDSGDLASSPIDLNPSYDRHSTCITDDQIRYDLIGHGANLDPGLLRGLDPAWVIESRTADTRPVTQPLKPAPQDDPWVLACAGSKAYLSASGSSIGDKANELDRSDPEVGPLVPPNPRNLEPSSPVLNAHDLQPADLQVPGVISTGSGGVGAVFSDGTTTAVLSPEGQVRTTPWLPPGISEVQGSTMVMQPGTASTTNTQVLVDLDLYDEQAATKLKDRLYG